MMYLCCNITQSIQGDNQSKIHSGCDKYCIYSWWDKGYHSFYHTHQICCILRWTKRNFKNHIWALHAHYLPFQLKIIISRFGIFFYLWLSRKNIDRSKKKIVKGKNNVGISIMYVLFPFLVVAIAFFIFFSSRLFLAFLSIQTL